jgi:hypothetical protein
MDKTEIAHETEKTGLKSKLKSTILLKLINLLSSSAAEHIGSIHTYSAVVMNVVSMYSTNIH